MTTSSSPDAPRRAPVGFRALALVALVFVIGVGTSYRLAWLGHRNDVAAARAAVADSLDDARASLSRELFAAVHLTEGLVAVVRLRDGVSQVEFESLSAAILERSAVTRHLALATGTVIRHVYPLRGNEAALGVDYLQLPDQRDTVLRALTERRTVVAGPLNLVQGGFAIIGRTPIFRPRSPDDPPGTDTYWGIAATVVSFDRLVDASGLVPASATLHIALRGRDGTGPTGPPFWGDAAVFDRDPVVLDVPLPSGSWAIAGVPSGGWPAFVLWTASEFLHGTAVSLALALLLFAVFRVSHSRRLEALARQRTEADLGQANRALTIKEATIESATSAVALVDLDGRVTYANAAFAAMFGRAREALVGLTFDDLVGSQTAADIARGLTEGGNWRGEATPKTDPEAKRELAGVADTVRDAAGEVLCRSLAFQDVTARKRMMAEVERGQRLAVLSLFAGGVAHDFNNLLAGLFGNVELARATLPAGSPAAAHLETAASAFERARDLTRRLLTFAIGSPPQRQPLPMRAFLNECCSLSLSGASCTWSVDTPAGDDTWQVFGDPNQLSQVFTNILVNARQAMTEGGHITVTARNRHVGPGDSDGTPVGRYVEVEVADEGPGIPADVLAHVFEPFFTTKPTGSGLGLAMAYSITQAHGGHISVTSRLGAGAAICLLLPAAVEPLPARPEPGADAPAEDTTHGRILFMDDERIVRDMAQRMLARGGYDVATARDGQDAIDQCLAAEAAGSPFDAVILDVTIQGGMGGREALRVLRQALPDLAIVLSSGYGEIGAGPADCRPTAVLPKPYQMHELLACARAVVSRRPPRA